MRTVQRLVKRFYFLTDYCKKSVTTNNAHIHFLLQLDFEIFNKHHPVLKLVNIYTVPRDQAPSHLQKCKSEITVETNEFQRHKSRAVKSNEVTCMSKRFKNQAVLLQQ